jgi:hypothetical protein
MAVIVTIGGKVYPYIAADFDVSLSAVGSFSLKLPYKKSGVGFDIGDPVEFTDNTTTIFSGFIETIQYNLMEDPIVVEVSGTSSLSRLLNLPYNPNLNLTEQPLIAVIYELFLMHRLRLRDVSTFTGWDDIINKTASDETTLFAQLQELIANRDIFFKATLDSAEDIVFVDIGDFSNVSAQPVYVKGAHNPRVVGLTYEKALSDVFTSIEPLGGEVKYDGVSQSATLQQYLYADVDRRLALDYPIVETETRQQFIIYNATYTPGGLVQSINYEDNAFDTTYKACGVASVDTAPDPDEITYNKLAVAFQPVAGELDTIMFYVESNTIDPSASGMEFQVDIRKVDESDNLNPEANVSLYSGTVNTPPDAGWWVIPLGDEDVSLAWGARYWIILSTTETTTDVVTYPALETNALYLSAPLTTNPDPIETNVYSVQYNGELWGATTRLPIVRILTSSEDDPIIISKKQTYSDIGSSSFNQSITDEQYEAIGLSLYNRALEELPQKNNATLYDVKIESSGANFTIGSRLRIVDSVLDLDDIVLINSSKNTFEGDRWVVDITYLDTKENPLLTTADDIVSATTELSTVETRSRKRFTPFRLNYVSDTIEYVIDSELSNSTLNGVEAYQFTIPYTLINPYTIVRFVGYAFVENGVGWTIEKTTEENHSTQTGPTYTMHPIGGWDSSATITVQQRVIYA